MYFLRQFVFLFLPLFLGGCVSWSSLRYPPTPEIDETPKLLIPSSLSQPPYTERDDVVLPTDASFFHKTNQGPLPTSSALHFIVTLGLTLAEDARGMTVFVPQEWTFVQQRTIQFLKNNGFSVSLLSHGDLQTSWLVWRSPNNGILRSSEDSSLAVRDRYFVDLHGSSSGTFVSFQHKQELSYLSFSKQKKHLVSAWKSCLSCGRYPLFPLMTQYLSFWGLNSSGIDRLFLLRTVKWNSALDAFKGPFVFVVDRPLKETWLAVRRALIRSGFTVTRENQEEASFLIRYIDSSQLPKDDSEGFLEKISSLFSSSHTQPLLQSSPYVIQLKPFGSGRTRLFIDPVQKKEKEDRKSLFFSTAIAVRILTIIQQNYLVV